MRMRTMRMRTATGMLVAAAAAIGIGASACAEAPERDSAGAAVPSFQDTVVPATDGLTASHALEAFPAERLGDWVSYADHVSLVTVLAERPLPWGDHERAYGEGMVARELTVQVDQVLWRGPTALRVPGRFRALSDGWALSGGQLSPIGTIGGPRLEVGGRYLAAWIYSSESGWGVLSVRAVFPVDEFGRAQRHAWSEPSLARDAVVGQLPAQVSWTLATARPDPRVARYAGLEPWQRRLMLAFESLPDRPGFLKATRERALGGELGYVREADWQRLLAEQDPTLEVPFYRDSGRPAARDEGGGITLDGYVLDD